MPLAWVIGGAVVGGAVSALSASDQNQQTQQAVNRQNEYNKKVYKFQYGDLGTDELGGEALRQYEHAVKGQDITIRNNERNLLATEEKLVRDYKYGMGIRAYEHAQETRVYEQSVARAFQQQSFNELAQGAALVDQDRLVHEQLISLAFDETETLLEYGAAAAGLGLKKRQAVAGAATEAQATRISALKAQGAAAARGTSGRSAAQNVQGMMAEAGARQAAIIDKLMFDLEATDQDLYKMNQQLILDKAGFDTTAESIGMSDKSARAKIQMQALQAAINAQASIALKPEISPALPIPYSLPRPEYQEIYKPAKPPEPLEGVAMTTNPLLAGLGGAISGAQSGLSIGSAYNTVKKTPWGG
jgi:hypothetical protein